MKKYILIIFILIFGAYLSIAYLLPIKLNDLPSSTVVYDANNVEIGEIIKDNKIRHRVIKYDEIPEFYKSALINIEDKSFISNNGISLRGLVRSTINNIKSGKVVEGGSTLSSQLIRNNLWLNDNRGIFKKSLEFIYSVRLNNLYSKNEILEKYVNQIYFGYMNYGLKSASIYYFGKEPSNLTKAEQIALLIIPKNIRKYDPYINKSNFSKRFDLISDYLEKNKLITKQEKISIKNEKLTFLEEHKNGLPYVIDFLKQILSPIRREQFETVPYEISTTIDYNLTSKIEEIGKNTIYDLAWKNVTDYGVLIVDRKTDELKVMIGGMNYYRKEGQVNSTLALRQPGSAVKPFTYVLAFKKFGIKPNDTILDLPVNYKTSLGYSYEPKNYSTDFKGEVTLAEALAQSINIPAVKLLEKVGVKNLLEFLRNLKITSLDKDEDHYGLALTLGDAEISLFELLQAYTIFPNDGTFCEFKYIKTEDLACKRIIDRKYTDSINEILSNRGFKLPGYPVNSALDFSDKKVFVKTGTSRNFRDNWTLGYSENYIIGVWTGNKNGENMKGVSGATGAGELFSRIVNYLEPSKNQEPGAEYSIARRSSGTSVQVPNNTSSGAKPKEEYLEITNPLNSEKFQINDFKPLYDQKIKLSFSTNMTYDKYFWFLDGNTVRNYCIVPKDDDPENKIPEKKQERCNSSLRQDFVQLKSGNHKLEIKLLKDGEIIGQSNISFDVQ